MKWRIDKLILVLVMLVWWLGLGVAQAAEFSAVVVTRADSQETKGKIYFQGEKMRQEFSTPEGVAINIARPDKQLMWVLMPAQKMAMEMPFSKSDLAKTMAMPKDQAQMNLLGTELVNGYETEKYETTMNRSGKTVKHYMWVAKKLGVPIKMVSLDGKFSMEYREIKEGGVSPAVFEIPPGYQKMPMPQGMPQGMPRKR
jgi:outer membrane lipoprotein-sorting protein